MLQLGLGNPMLIEADAFWLPDTRGVSYGQEHTKTSIVVLHADPDTRELVYLHNEGLHRLDGVLGQGVPLSGAVPGRPGAVAPDAFAPPRLCPAL